MKIKLFIEGSSDKSNGDLRQGFRKLLQPLLPGAKFQIIMGGGKSQAIRKFKKAKDDECLLLIDLDAPQTNKDQDLETHVLNGKADRVFYMIQEMEAWFIAQSAMLDDYYKTDISRRLPGRPAHEISEPAKKLEQATSRTQKGKYHKVKDGNALLQRLNGVQLMEAFEEVRQLVEALKGN